MDKDQQELIEEPTEEPVQEPESTEPVSPRDERMAKMDRISAARANEVNEEILEVGGTVLVQTDEVTDEIPDEQTDEVTEEQTKEQTEALQETAQEQSVDDQLAEQMAPEEDYLPEKYLHSKLKLKVHGEEIETTPYDLIQAGQLSAAAARQDYQNKIAERDRIAREQTPATVEPATEPSASSADTPNVMDKVVKSLESLYEGDSDDAAKGITEAIGAARVSAEEIAEAVKRAMRDELEIQEQIRVQAEQERALKGFFESYPVFETNKALADFADQQWALTERARPDLTIDQQLDLVGRTVYQMVGMPLPEEPEEPKAPTDKKKLDTTDRATQVAPRKAAAANQPRARSVPSVSADQAVESSEANASTVIQEMRAARQPDRSSA